MRNPIPQIWQTYWLRFHTLRNWFLIVGVLLALFFTGMAPLFWGARDSRDLRKLAPTLTEYDPKEILTLSHRTSADFPPLPADVEEILQLRNVRPDFKALSVNVNSLNPLDVEQLRRIDALHQLILSADKIPAGVLTVVAPHLTELKISSQLLLDHHDELPQLKNVHTLITDNKNLSKPLFEAVAKIPNLHSFVITDQRDLQENSVYESVTSGHIDLTPDELTPLLQHPRLTAIYANWSPKSALPTQYLTTIFPYFYSTRPIMMLWLAMFPLLAMWYWLYSHTIDLCHRSASRLIPDSRSPHLFVATTIFSIVLLICLAGLRLGNLSPLASLAICLSPILVCVLYDKLLAPRDTKYRNSAAVLIPTVIISADRNLSRYHLGLLMKSLEGHFAISMLLASVAMIAVIVVLVKDDMQYWGLTPDPRRRNRFFRRSISEPIPTYALPLTHTRPSQSFLQTVWRWREGIQPISWQSTLIVIAVALGYLIVTIRSVSHWESLQSFVVFMLFLVPVSTLARTVKGWSQRQQSLSNESLRPFSRRQFVNHMTCAISINFLYLAAFVTAFFLICLAIPAIHKHTVELLYSLPLILASTIFCWSLALAFFIESRRAQDFGILFITFVVFIIQAFMISLNTGTPTQLLYTSLLVLTIVLPLSLLIAFTTYFRTLNYEWGVAK